MSSRDTPLVSVGMPAFNAESTLRFAVEAIQRQTLADFELIICDNASTDATWSIAQQLADGDPRIVLHRQPRNVGANGNYCKAFELARGEYFKWASSNDWIDPRFLESCIGLLQARPDVVMAAPRTWTFVDELEQRAPYDADVAFEDEDPVHRLKRVSMELRLNNVLNGVVHTQTLRQTRLIEHYVGADIVLVGELALRGKIALLPDRLFYRRMSMGFATAMMTAQQKQIHHYPVPDARSLFPSWRRSCGRMTSVLQAPLTFSQRGRALAWCMRQSLWQSRAMGLDVLAAARYLRQP